MKLYKWIREEHSVRRLDGRVFYNQPGSEDWEHFLAWVAEGNTPDPSGRPPLNLSDVAKVPKEVRAAVMAAAIMSGKTKAQAKAAFVTAWQNLE